MCRMLTMYIFIFFCSWFFPHSHAEGKTYYTLLHIYVFYVYLMWLQWELQDGFLICIIHVSQNMTATVHIRGPLWCLTCLTMAVECSNPALALAEAIPVFFRRSARCRCLPWTELSVFMRVTNYNIYDEGATTPAFHSKRWPFHLCGR